jgi:hypothetical protein
MKTKILLCPAAGDVIEEIGWKGMAYIHLARDRDKWRDLVFAVMNLWVP